jgi:hypothetical protein
MKLFKNTEDASIPNKNCRYFHPFWLRHFISFKTRSGDSVVLLRCKFFIHPDSFLIWNGAVGIECFTDKRLQSG